MIQSLLRVYSTSALNTCHLRGALFENLIISESLKARYNQALTTNLYFWRDRDGHEVDLIIDQGDNLRPVEIKSGTTLNADFFKSIKKWRHQAGERCIDATLIHGGDQKGKMDDIEYLPWPELASTPYAL